MKNLVQKMMGANFGRLLKRWVIAVLCVILLGGGISAALLSPQIREAAVAVQTIHQQKDQWEHDFPDGVHDHEEDRNHEEGHRERFEAEDIFRSSVSRPSTAAVISVGGTALLCGLLALCFWLLVAGWLYQAAVLSGMSGPLWGVLGLLGNVFTAVLFIIVRSFLRRKCPACGRWQDKKAAYCTVCGAPMGRKCSNCGADCPADSKFCPACGGKLTDTGSEGGKTC